jgi:cell division protease FtsH
MTELVFQDVSTGAQNDLQRANSIARSMVMDFGMSRLGRVNYRESSRSPFLATGGDFHREHSHSEQTAREIDQEVKRIVTASHERAYALIVEHRVQLEKIADELLAREVLDGEQVRRIIAGLALEEPRPSRPEPVPQPTDEGRPRAREPRPSIVPPLNKPLPQE